MEEEYNIVTACVLQNFGCPNLFIRVLQMVIRLIFFAIPCIPLGKGKRRRKTSKGENIKFQGKIMKIKSEQELTRYLVSSQDKWSYIRGVGRVYRVHGLNTQIIYMGIQTFTLHIIVNTTKWRFYNLLP